MNWYKTAKLSDFSDRNIINESIDDLKAITVKLAKLAKIVFQTASETQKLLREIMDSKKLTTFPKIQKLLEEADECCLDSPHRFAELCKEAAGLIVHRITAKEKERSELINHTMPEKWKGWRET